MSGVQLSPIAPAIVAIFSAVITNGGEARRLCRDAAREDAAGSEVGEQARQQLRPAERDRADASAAAAGAREYV